ncbi:snare protein-like protein ykt6 [Lophiostoma macrostomum CBS 122681]|uniref:Snare protein-like protein ykt6 n=1 Tax=Lophiostoma macrostomum CBS 122681 TaxID=1314788 RepID=A0A6A6T6C3_9PLEO|nr:snare protein-like protein ykt6 [Lophiostoma macrostomum CBS 122681]
MKIVYIGIFQTLNPTAEGYRMARESHLKGTVNYFAQNNVIQLMTVACAAAAKSGKIQQGKKVKVEGDEQLADYTLYFRARSEGIVAGLITDKEYPERVAFALLDKTAGDFCDRYPRSAFANMPATGKDDPDPFPLPELKTYITQYQDPASADTITKIQNELEETKAVLYKSIDAALERGEKMDNLVNKSEQVSATSKLFYTQAKKQNSCCVVM